jgi:hypothetical protein
MLIRPKPDKIGRNTPLPLIASLIINDFRKLSGHSRPVLVRALRRKSRAPNRQPNVFDSQTLFARLVARLLRVHPRKRLTEKQNFYGESSEI